MQKLFPFIKPQQVRPQPHVSSVKILFNSALNEHVNKLILLPSSSTRTAFLPGQWMRLKLKNTQVEGRFSMTNAPNINWLLDRNELHFAIKSSQHPISQYIHQEYNDKKMNHRGDDTCIEMIGSHGNGDNYYVQPRKDQLSQLWYNPLNRINLIGGGVGIAPLNSIWNYLYSKHTKNDLLPNTNVKLLYSCKHTRDFLFVNQFTTHVEQQKHDGAHFHVHFNISTTDQQQQQQHDHTNNDKLIQLYDDKWSSLHKNGSIRSVSIQPIDPQLLLEVFFNNDNPEENRKYGLFYICGPLPMNIAIEEMLLSMGVDKDRIIWERPLLL